jgi:hypothetical protein
MNDAQGLNLSKPGAPVRGLRTGLVYLVAALCIVTLVWAGWHVVTTGLYTSGSDIGYYLGVTGGTMMLILFTYPRRKRAGVMRTWGPLKYWFRLHMICGVCGPVVILFHSTFHVGSLNATVAISCMVLVAASGLIGRFIYRKIHHGLYGSRATLAECQKALTEELTRLEPLLSPMPELRVVVDGFSTKATQHPVSLLGRATHFVLLTWHRRRARQRARQMLTHAAGVGGGRLSGSERKRVMQVVGDTLQGIQLAAQFSAYERLFSLWHVLHIPFVYIFVFSAIVHVVAVHTY